MSRNGLFEIHDHPMFPSSLRDLVTDALQALWNWSNSYKPVLPRLSAALGKMKTTAVLDLCSGGGGPWLRLVSILEAEHRSPINICLTDKYPNQEAFEKAYSTSHSRITFDLRSVNASEVPSELKGFRTMFSAFHHFETKDAREVLKDAIDHGEGIAIFEMAMREPRIICSIFAIPFMILFLTLGIRPFRWSRLIWTYVVPVVPFVLWFDGLMSCWRAYSLKELRELVKDLPGETYRWDIGTQFGGFLPVTYLIGCPANREHAIR